jgi:hypothetical protein
MIRESEIRHVHRGGGGSKYAPGQHGNTPPVHLAYLQSERKWNKSLQLRILSSLQMETRGHYFFGLWRGTTTYGVYKEVDIRAETLLHMLLRR